MELVKKEAPALLRQDLRHSEAPAMILRRAVIGSSLIGIACMAVTTLFQSGMLKRLKDVPLAEFDSDKVNSSDLAYGWGLPDSPISILAHAAAIAIASYGAAGRAQSQPMVPLAATAAALPGAATAARYLFHDMPVTERRWCPYCIVDALAHIAALGFTLWESKQAISRLRRG